MSKICIIPARGGSKRIPRKNVNLFLGKPIIAYSIEAALNSKLFDEVMVSTDDSEIAEIAKKFGAKVPFLRSRVTSTDFATTYDVIEEVLLMYKSIKINFEYVCCLYPCAPFVTNKELLNSYEILKANKFDSVFPVMSFGFPIQRALKINSNQTTTFFYPEFNLTRTQDLEKSYHDAGQFYWMNIKKCMKLKKILTDNSGAIIISELKGQDIDNESDWKLAELKYELLQGVK